MIKHSDTTVKKHIIKAVPNPEVTEKAVRRRFTAEYKLRILREADACTRQGQLGALLRREGLYSSNLILWRRQIDEGLVPKKSTSKRRSPLCDKARRGNNKAPIDSGEILLTLVKSLPISHTALHPLYGK
jgi:transposase-like protein